MNSGTNEDSLFQPPSSDRTNQLGAIILAGGKSMRMGENKCRLLYQGESFLSLLIRRFRSVDLPVVVVSTNQSIPTLTDPNVQMVSDERIDCGPLEGIRVGLSRLATQAEFAFVTGCDAPLLRIEFVNSLLAQIGSFQAIMPRSNENIYGLTAIYRTDIHPIIARQLSGGRRSVQGLINVLDTKTIDVETLRVVDPNLDSLLNINSPDDYQQLLRRPHID